MCLTWKCNNGFFIYYNRVITYNYYIDVIYYNYLKVNNTQYEKSKNYKDLKSIINKNN